MRRSVDPAGEPRHSDKARFTQIACDAFGKFHSGRRRISRADNCDQRLLQHLQLATQGDNRWRIVDHLQARWIVGLAEHEIFDADRTRRFQFAFGFLAGADVWRTGGAAAARQAWKSSEGRPSAAVISDQVPESAGANILAPNEPEPIEPLLVI